jgi:hypothetical protein
VEHTPQPAPEEEPPAGPDVVQNEQAATEPERPDEDPDRKTEVAYAPDTPPAEPPAVTVEQQRQKKSGWWNRSW